MRKHSGEYPSFYKKAQKLEEIIIRGYITRNKSVSKSDLVKYLINQDDRHHVLRLVHKHANSNSMLKKAIDYTQLFKGI